MRTDVRKGRMLMRCPSCDRWWRFDSPEKWTGYCPGCGDVMNEMTCLRCGHRWRSRRTQTGIPKTCPKCCSPYWNRERLMGDTTDMETDTDDVKEGE
ncbi:MAG: hypothetical protein IJX35_04060 [Candidatus Methanomethylophilaceae archaeon]|nr:hypothetical protein [Candidatus Methanomethylophilaceae archaeon]